MGLGLGVAYPIELLLIRILRRVRRFDTIQ
jgi:hypothetical protein